MGNIAPFIEKIKSAIYGKDVRQSICDALEASNTTSETAEANSTSAITIANESNTKSDSAVTTANEAKEEASQAQYYAGLAKESETNAKTSEKSAQTAESNAKTSESNAKASAELAEQIATTLEGAFIPAGSVKFADLPSIENIKVGWTYDILDDFTTTSDFKEGEGITYPAGTDVYKDKDGYLNTMSGAGVLTVNGKKGQVTLEPIDIEVHDGASNLESFINSVESYESETNATISQLNTDLTATISSVNSNLTARLDKCLYRELQEFHSDLGFKVDSKGNVYVKTLGINPGGYYVLKVSIDGYQNGTTSDSTLWAWLNYTYILRPMIATMFGVDKTKIIFKTVSVGHFRYCSCWPTTMWGYAPCTIGYQSTETIGTNDYQLEFARYYTTSGDVAGHSLNNVITGYYGFDNIVAIEISD